MTPTAVTLLALLLHLLLADHPTHGPAPSFVGAYPVLVAIVLVASLLLATTERWWPGGWRSYAPLVAGAVLVLTAWDLLTQKLGWLPLPFFPGPDRVFASMVDDRAILFTSAWRSLLLLLMGYSAGVAAGFVSGVVIGWFPPVRYWAMPAMKIIGPIPATALIPLMMMLSHESFVPATLLIGFATWFPVTMLTSSGVASVRLSHLEVARTLGAGPWYLIRHVAIPSALPNVFIGLFMGLLAAFLTLVVAEAVGVTAGLGHYLKTQQGYMMYANYYGALIITAAFCSGSLTLLFRLRDWMLRWQVGIIKW